MIKTTICLPKFEGFYESQLDDIIDSHIESELDAINEEREGRSGVILRPLRYEDLVINHQLARELVAKSYLDIWYARAVEEFSLDKCMLAPTFVGIESPHEYNFATDDLLFEASFNHFALRKYATNPVNLLDWRKFIRDRHTSYDGFASFYSNDCAVWSMPTKRYPTTVAQADRYNPPLQLVIEDLLQFYLENEGFYDEWTEYLTDKLWDTTTSNGKLSGMVATPSDKPTNPEADPRQQELELIKP